MYNAEIERQFTAGRFEIVDGVLTEMAPPIFDGSFALSHLSRTIEAYLAKTDPRAALVPEVDLILGKRRFGIVDALYLNPEDMRRQRIAHAASGRQKHLQMGRILVPPTLVIESISQGHESHDRETKRGWYEEFRIPNYWILDGLKRSLECLRLEAGRYQVDCFARGSASLRPKAFPGLVIPLKKIWL